MNIKQGFVGILMIGCLIGVTVLLPSVSQAQDAKVKTAMEHLKSMAAKLWVLRRQKGLIPSQVSRFLSYILDLPR
jgi:hypothetical protein